jgi:hypothetical protein
VSIAEVGGAGISPCVWYWRDTRIGPNISQGLNEAMLMMRRMGWLAFAYVLAGPFPPAPTHAVRNRPTERAAPGVIVFSGGSLRTPIALSDWSENLDLMLATTQLASAPTGELAQRQRIAVAMYWGSGWRRFASTPDSLALLPRLKPAQGGAYYPPAGARPAVWVFGPMGASPSSMRVVAPRGMAILMAHGLPGAAAAKPAR